MSGAGADPKSELARHALRVAIAVGVAIGMVSLLVLLWLAVDVLLLGFAGILLAVLLRGLGNWLARHSPLTGAWSVLVVILVLAGLFGLGLWLSAATVVQQLDTLARILPHIAEALQLQLSRYEWGKWLVDRALEIDWTSRRVDVLGKTTGALSSVFGAVVNLIIVGFLGLYLALQPHVYLNGLLHLVPVPVRPRMSRMPSMICENSKSAAGMDSAYCCMTGLSR